MNEIEARGKIKYRIANEMRKYGENKEEYEDLEIALLSMKELREYRELGTVEEIKSFFNENRKAGYKHGYSDGYAKAVDDFAGNMKDKSSDILFWLMKRQEEGYGTSNGELHDKWLSKIDEIAEYLKGGAE